ncbi:MULTISPECIES: PspA/IM30 family protein [Lysinibacillus]|uniref:PspA/IM30 family protein n=1 Tax=Lysinibacillus antri TaxID=2498145 RepID=A0A3S0R7L7_9BACI|nr:MULTISPECIES: PspA/IM30 family protein [Lysinibacillus]RUL55108.1 PspA/IM30 family protein [Lysinibacillus antri]TSI10110.1 PspA/IM30 family protein [Lysinibacillus sp. BW-2-10]
MSLLKRFKYTIEADLHEMFDKKERKNPIAMLNQYIREAEKQTEQTGKLLQRQAQLKEQLQSELKETTEMLEKRTNQLQLAQANKEEDLILFATQEVEAYQTRQFTLVTSLEQATEEFISLERKFETMKHKIKDMKVRQLQLMGKENVTRAHHKMDHVLKSNEETDFNDLSSYIDNLANNIEKDYERTQLEARLAQLEKTAVVTPALELKEQN